MQRMLNIARLVGVCEKIEGRKKFQKIVHLLREAGYRREFCHQFGYLHYGPYSRELRDEIDLLTDDSVLVDESECRIGDYTTFVYTPTDELCELFQELGLVADPEWAGLAKDLNSREAKELEAMSTVVYLRRLGNSGEGLRAKFTSLKPTLCDRLDKAITETEHFISVVT
jgi:uncharacterized protein YwgA